MTTVWDVPGSNPPNPFTAPIQALLASSNHSSAPAPAFNETAAHLVAILNTSPNAVNAIWQLWDAFFVAVITSSTPCSPFLALLDALRAQPPARPSRAPSTLPKYTQADGKLHWEELPEFRSQWVDVHDSLEASRDWDGVRASGAGGSGDKYYLRFCVFSAALLKATKGKGEVHPISVFYACRNVLESAGPQPDQPRVHRLSPAQVWALDVRITAIWVRDGAEALWETDYEELREHWAATLDYKTDLWPKEDGLTRDRWRLWKERLRTLSMEEGRFGEETRATAAEAAYVIDDILTR